MRQAFFLNGKKQRFEHIEDAHAAVIASYPGAKREGSVGCWGWEKDGFIVAEAWIAKKGWWLIIAKDGGKMMP
jgi:hypothetical protein